MHYPIFYTTLVDTMRSVLASEGLADNKAKSYAEKAAFKFCQENGGDLHRVPMLKGIKKQERDSKIRGDSKNMNTKQLMKKYDVSESVVLRALK